MSRVLQSPPPHDPLRNHNYPHPLNTSPRRPLRRSESSVFDSSHEVPGTTALPQRPASPLHGGARGTVSGHRRTESTLKTVMRKIFSRNKRRSDADDDGDDLISHPSIERSPGPPTGLSNGLSNGLSTGPPGGGTFYQSPRTRSTTTTDSGSPLYKPDSRHIAPRGDLRGTPHQSPKLLESIPDQLEELPPPHRRRRATLPSMVFPDDDARSILADIVNHDRLTSDHESQSRASSIQNASGTRSTLQSKRRSRSATALRAAARGHHRMSPIQWRRSSADASYKAPPTPFETASVTSYSIRPPTRTTVGTESNWTEAEVPSSETAPVETETESVAYDVGQLMTTIQHGDNVTLEQRLTTLEVKLIDLEFAIARMQTHQCPEPSSPSGDKSKVKKDLQGHTRNKESDSIPSTKSEPVEHLHPPPPPPPPREDRPVSTSTVRPTTGYRSQMLRMAPSMSSMRDFDGISVEQYSALVTLLRREQSARRNLETQVATMQEDMRRLHKLLGTGPMHPVRNSDSRDFINFRRALDASRGISPAHTDENIGVIYDSDSEIE
ncbi:hypothetical protein ASPZODRAFT_1272551 [Penicilliopsis zonata CBS 506.65]|uniref:Uncharacterized protein n=1 Tax=Penicilliopsis zonata CBS 506.65 TaxID=1073090 RepID=A0A1L9S6N9_9EURO|nr:hypothetical protein ASPZODRAFT_1272551 [Penicilliopsis zonata CBS 506.65]OJJ42837.1 hypothetical protein ASPZODRAFT_1272551 [Penicilliopsis zonata CBS 506.65]